MAGAFLAGAFFAGGAADSASSSGTPTTWATRLVGRGDACFAAASVPAASFSGSSDSSVGAAWCSSHTAPSGGMVTVAEASKPLEGTGCAIT